MPNPYIIKTDPYVIARQNEFCFFIKAMLQNKMCSDTLLSPPACSLLSRLPELIMPAGQKRSVPVHARFYQIQSLLVLVLGQLQFLQFFYYLLSCRYSALWYLLSRCFKPWLPYRTYMEFMAQNLVSLID